MNGNEYIDTLTGKSRTMSWGGDPEVWLPEDGVIQWRGGTLMFEPIVQPALSFETRQVQYDADGKVRQNVIYTLATDEGPQRLYVRVPSRDEYKEGALGVVLAEAISESGGIVHPGCQIYVALVAVDRDGRRRTYAARFTP